MDRGMSYDSEIVSRRSGWSTFFYILAGFAFTGAIVTVFAGLFVGQKLWLAWTPGLIASGLANLFFGFIIDVLTDIRWYLQGINANSQYLQGIHANSNVANQYHEANYNSTQADRTGFGG